ncbi:MFS general substrate transporter [Thozetella sp. PMI_491]|nr:MFS general substrate transporter [Thozetella sp. PMI_491]
MPEFPHNARMLNPDQCDLAVWRFENECGSAEAHEEAIAWDGLKAAVSDKKLWLLVWCGGMAQAMGSVFNFFSSIIASLQCSKYESLLLTVPPYFVAMIGYYICSFLSDRYNKIYIITVVNLLASTPVYILGMLAPNVGSRYFAMCLMPVVSVAPQVMLYKTNGLHMARPASKRALGMALINGLGGLSNVWTSYLWSNGGPQYYKAFGTLLACGIVFQGLQVLG